jgi:chromosome segregation ATPase
VTATITKLAPKTQTPDEVYASAERRLDSAQRELADFENRRAAAEIAIAMADDAAQPLALGAARGDATAIGELAKLRDDQVKARQQLENLAIAIEQAREEVSKASRELIEAQDDRIFARAEGLAAEFIEESRKIDAALATIADAWARRKEPQHELGATRCLNADLVDRLVCLVRLNIAVRYAGAQMVVIGPMRSEENCTPLALEDRKTLAHLDASNRKRQF